MKNAIIAVILTALVSGCGLVRAAQVKELQEKGDAAAAECKVNNPTSAKKNNVAQATCLDVVIDTYTRPISPNPDLIDLYKAKRMAIAVRMDRGEVGYEQGLIEMAEVRSAVIGESQRRSNSATMANAAQQQADAASMAAFSAAMPKTCNRIGNSVTCY